MHTLIHSAVLNLGRILCQGLILEVPAQFKSNLIQVCSDKNHGHVYLWTELIQN
jgi:hypothetical protein